MAVIVGTSAALRRQLHGVAIRKGGQRLRLTFENRPQDQPHFVGTGFEDFRPDPAACLLENGEPWLETEMPVSHFDLAII